MMNATQSNRRSPWLTLGFSALMLLPAGAQNFFTGPYGPGGTWNLYEVVNTAAQFSTAKAAAQLKTADQTGLVAATTGGHLIAISSRDENSFAVAAAAVITGSPNIWLGLTDDPAFGGVESGAHNVNDPGANRGAGWVWLGEAGAATGLQATDFVAWAPGEPNNSGTAPSENVAELRADGLWNDHLDNAATTRKYVIEWDLNSPIAIAGARQLPLFATYRSGGTGKYNLYQFIMTPCQASATPADVHLKYLSWIKAQEEAAATPASSLGLAGVTATGPGHLIAVGNGVENNLVARLHGLYGGNSGTNFWCGLTDDPAYGGSEAGTNPNSSGWKWAGATDTYDYQRWLNSRPFVVTNTTPEPTNAGGVEHHVEIRGDGFWNDLNGAQAYNPAAVANAFWRRAVYEWEIQAVTPVLDPLIANEGAGLPPVTAFATGTRTFANSHAVGQWAVKEIRLAASAGNTTAAVAAANDPGAAPVIQGVSPVMNFTDCAVNGTTVRDGLASRQTSGLFYPKMPYFSDTVNVDDNYLVINAKTRVTLVAGQAYTVNVHSDDGFALRLSGGPGGSKIGFISSGGYGLIDPADLSTMYVMGSTGDSNSRGIFVADTAGDYDVELIHWEGAGGSGNEVSWAVGAYQWDWEAKWTLLGGTQPVTGTTTPSTGDAVTWTYSPLFPAAGKINVPAPVGQAWELNFVQSTAYAAGPPPTGIQPNNLFSGVAVLQAAGLPVTPQSLPVLNLVDESNVGRRGFFVPDQQYPGSNLAADDNNYVVGARTLWRIPAGGFYTVMLRADDTVAMRLEGGKGAYWTGRVTGGNGRLDAYDNLTLWHEQGGGDSNIRAVAYFPSAGDYELELVHMESTGGSNLEVFYAPGVNFIEQDTAAWQLIGEVAALTPTLPATIANSTPSEGAGWGIHLAKPASGQVGNFATALATLQDAGTGSHFRAQYATLNLAEPDYPGPGGLFAGNDAVPGEVPGVGDDDFAVHARTRIQITTGGLHTFAIRGSEAFAFRIKGQQWLAVANNAALDPTSNHSCIMWPAVGGNGPVDSLARGLINLAAGYYDVELVTFERNGDFHMEVYAVPGDYLGVTLATPGTPEYAAAPSGTNLAPFNLNWRLVGYVSSGAIAQPGIDAAGFAVLQTLPALATAPTGWVGNIAGADAWLDGVAATNGYAPASPAPNPTYINWNDPGFGGPGSVPNDAAFFRNTQNGTANQDDNYYATRFTANVVIPADGTYTFGWQGDDGGYFEFLGNPAGFSGFTRLVANGVPTGADPRLGQSTIANSSDGTVRGRIACNAGGGNTRTLGEIFLKAGTYPVRIQWFEATGGSYFEILASSSPPNARVINLLTAPISTTYTTGAATGIADVSGLVVLPQSGQTVITNPGLTPAGNQFTFQFNSLKGTRYQVESSLNLVGWSPEGAPIDGTGAVVTFVTPPFTGSDTKKFWRVRVLD
jgi:hypothetical protein